MAKKIGVVGVGRMGANMARRLKDCGYKVTAVFDINKGLASELAEEIGGTSCKTFAEVTSLADVILTVVTDDKAMDKVFAAGGNSLLKGAKGKTFINCATISPKTHVKVEARAKKAGALARY